MDQVVIRQIRGNEAKQAIDEFYRSNGSKGVARDDDLFFIAFMMEKMVGCVRFCVEEGTPMLRTMYVDSSCRQRGIGRQLLLAFGDYLDGRGIQNVFCLPFTHLERFYGLIGFEIVDSQEVPKFLIDRAEEYARNGTKTLFMRRI